MVSRASLDVDGVLGLQRLAGNSAVAELFSDTSTSVQSVTNSSGNPLDATVRAKMELGLGVDLGEVRVHSDDAAARSARALSARAYTVGNHIAFDAGQYAPENSEGQKVLAHELIHVVQQRSGPVSGAPMPGGISVSSPEDEFERAAETSGERLMSGTTGLFAAPSSGHGPVYTVVSRLMNVQRQSDSDHQNAARVIVTPEDIEWTEELVRQTQAGGQSRQSATAQTLSVQRAGGCWGDKFNLAAAILATVSAGALTIVAVLAPDPTTLTKWAAIGLAAGILAGIAWTISAAIQLKNCLAQSDAPDRDEQIRHLEREIEQLQRTQEELRRLKDRVTPGSAPAGAVPVPAGG